MEHILKSIICSQFDYTFGRNRPDTKTVIHTHAGRIATVDAFSEPFNAMQVKFTLLPEYGVEDGFRNLSILIFGNGSNYIAVYVKIDWKVSNSKKFVEGETPWVCYGYHDSCWRESVETIMREFKSRMCTIDYLFNGKTGWYKNVPLNEEQISELRKIREARYDEGGSDVKASSLEFHFPHKHKLGHCVAGSYCTVEGCNYVE